MKWQIWIAVFSLTLGSCIDITGNDAEIERSGRISRHRCLSYCAGAGAVLLEIHGFPGQYGECWCAMEETADID